MMYHCLSQALLNWISSSSLYRLELELKRLRQENEDLKLDKFHTDANKILALETENKKLSLTIQQLQVGLYLSLTFK